MVSNAHRSAALRGLLAACLLVTSAGATALGRVVPLGEFEADHPAQITWVTTCGQWAADGRDGFFRVVHAERYAQSYLYIQWMARSAEGDHVTVATTPLPQVNNDHADILLNKLRCKVLKNGIAVQAQAHFGHENAQGTVQVRAFANPGAHRFSHRVLPSR